jgi:hypothetical protein
MATSRSILSLSLFRELKAHDAEYFDGKPQNYCGWDETHPYGTARLAWDALRPDLDELNNNPEPSPSLQKRLGDALSQFLEDLLKGRSQNWPHIADGLLDAEKTGRPTTLKLRLGAIELFALPWELARLGAGTLGGLQRCVIQYEWAPLSSPSFPTRSPGRLLFAWSKPEQWIPVLEHRRALAGAGGDFHELPEMNLASLRIALAKAADDGAPVRVLHLLCHGTKVANEIFGLALHPDDQHADADRVTGDRLAAALGPSLQHLQCVVLSACHSSNAGPFGTMFGGVAHEFHRRGVPAVIASRYPLSSTGSEKLTTAFYQALYRDKTSILDAFQAARAALSTSWFDWASLQLFINDRPAPEVRKPPRRVELPKATRLPKPVRDGLAVLVEMNVDIPSAAVMDALGGRLGDTPDLVALQPLGRIGSNLPEKPEEWTSALEQIDKFAELLRTHVAKTGTRTVHLFGAAPLPMMFQLGFRLARQPLKVYQAHKDWGFSWSELYNHELEADKGPTFFTPPSWPDPASTGERIAVTIEVTHKIEEQKLEKWLGSGGARNAVRLVAACGPSNASVKDAMDVARAIKELTGCLNRIGREFHQANEIWLAFACPASFALALGRAYHPNAQKQAVLFNYRGKEGYVEVSRPT